MIDFVTAAVRPSIYARLGSLTVLTLLLSLLVSSFGSSPSLIVAGKLVGVTLCTGDAAADGMMCGVDAFIHVLCISSPGEKVE